VSLLNLTPSLSALRDPYSTPRPGDRSRRQRASDDDVPAPPDAWRDGQPEDPTPAAEPAPFAAILKTDLTGLTDLDPRNRPESREAAASANDFLGAFSMLLASVGSGDAGAARNAATVLQLELFGGATALAATEESAEEAQARMLDDLLSLIRFARLGDLGAAEAAARHLARHMQTALLAPARPLAPVERLAGRKRAPRNPGVQEPASLVQGATAAYELLMELDAGANAA
jgi:hypothetical protein